MNLRCNIGKLYTAFSYSFVFICIYLCLFVFICVYLLTFIFIVVIICKKSINKYAMSNEAKGETLMVYLTVRISPDLKKKFLKKASSYGKPVEIHRELLTAFVQDRITIERPVDKKEKLYKK